MLDISTNQARVLEKSAFGFLLIFIYTCCRHTKPTSCLLHCTVVLPYFIKYRPHIENILRWKH